MAFRRNNVVKGSKPHLKKPAYKFLVSACLVGNKCTFRGGDNFDKKTAGLFYSGLALAACPEVVGGLGVPRKRSEILSGGGAQVLNGKSRVINTAGDDLTRRYVDGSLKLLALAKKFGIKRAILKSDSPACGIGRIYDGTFSGKYRMADGVFAAALRREGFKLYDEKAKKYE